MTDSKEGDQYSKQETARRLDAIMRGAFSGSPKSYEESKLGKPKRKPKKSPTISTRKKPVR
jgi:hypothetical protein